MSSQQTVLRVQTNIPSTTLTGQTETRDLDLYSDVPIKIFRSFAEVQDISKRNSDYTIGLSLPGSKRNNVFFENFYDVNQQTLYFDATKRVPAKVVIDGDIYFRGYLKLDKMSVIDTKIEYSVTLYSEIADLYGAIGNGLLKDLDYSSINHELRNEFVINDWNGPNYENGEPYPYLYSVIHNGYIYDGEFPDYGITNLYSSTITGNWATLAEAQAATLPNRINSVQSDDSAGGIYLNQMKPALNVKWLVEKIITERGYTIKSDFFKTPWFKLLYLYGYFNSADSVLSATFENYEVLPKTGVDIRYIQEDLGDGQRKVTYYVVKRGTGIPCICSEPLYVVNRFRWDRFFLFPDQFVNYTSTIQPNNTTLIVDTNDINFTNRDKFDWLSTFISPNTGGGVGFYEGGMTYLPEGVGDTIPIDYGDEVNFAKIMSKDIKQIDFLASIAKKFNLLFIPNPVNPKELLIEPYDYYIGTGDIYDWSDKLAVDKGYSVEPALNFIESELIMTDKEDGDAGNKSYKDKFDRIYGENKVYNPTEFKSSTKTIDTIFSPQIVSKWDVDVTNPKVGNIGLPLAINYVEGTSTLSGDDDNEVNINIFEGVKTKPKLFYHCGNFSPFLDAYGELIQTPFSSTNYTTWYPKIQRPGSTQINTLALAKRLPVVSHTIPTGNPDSNKINNDSACILFGSEQPVNLAGIPTYNTYTDNDVYSLYYENRINNLFNPQTRFFKGKFDLKLNDVKNLKPNDIIKLNGQYFTWNKIAGYDLTNPPQLTEVELIQVEINPRVYPTRYFEYYYNDDPSEKFSIVSDFTNDTYEGTNYAWSVTYDYFVGVLGGSVSGYTSSVKDTTQGTFAYIPYTIYEVSEEHYLSGSTIDRTGDPIYIWSKTFGPDLGDTYPVWGNSASGTDTYEWLNVFTNYSDFQSKRSPWFFTEGASNTHGAAITPTPTATMTPTPTPTPAQQEPGSLIIHYTKLVDLKSHNYVTYVDTGDGSGYLMRDRHFDDTENLYTTYLNDGDDVNINLFCEDTTLYDYDYSVIRRDYTNDDQGGDMGIIDTEITGVTKTTFATSYQLEFTVQTNPDAYNYEYRLILSEKSATPPTPTPTPTSEVCWGCRGDIDLYGPIRAMGLDSRDTLFISFYESYLKDTTTKLDYTGCGTNQFVEPIDYDLLFDIGPTGNLFLSSLGGPNLIAIADNVNMEVFDQQTVDLSNITPLCSLSDGSVMVFEDNFSGATINKFEADLSGYDPTYNSQQLYAGTGTFGFIGKFSDDSILVYGRDTYPASIPGYFIKRINSDGTDRSGWVTSQTWNSGEPGDSGRPRGMETTNDGGLLLFGDFGEWRQTSGDTFNSVSDMVKLEYNGVLDTSFTNYGFINTHGVENVVLYDAAELSDGSIVIVGEFTSYAGVTANRVVKINQYGVIDTTFATNVGSGFATTGQAFVKVDSNDFIYIGGGWSTFNGDATQKYLIRLDSDGNNTTCRFNYNGVKPLPTPETTPTPFPTNTPQAPISIDASVSFVLVDVPLYGPEVSLDFDAVRLILTPVDGGDSYDSGLIDPNLQLSGATGTMTHTFSTFTGNYQTYYNVQVWIKVDYDNFDGSFVTLDARQGGSNGNTRLLLNGVVSGGALGVTEYEPCSDPYPPYIPPALFPGWRMYEVGSTACAGYVMFEMENEYLFETTGNTTLDIEVQASLVKNYGLPTPTPTGTPTPTPTATPGPPTATPTPTATPGPINIIPILQAPSQTAGLRKYFTLEYSVDSGSTWNSLLSFDTTDANPSYTGSTLTLTEGTFNGFRVRRGASKDGSGTQISYSRFCQMRSNNGSVLVASVSSNTDVSIPTYPTFRTDTLSTFPSMTLSSSNNNFTLVWSEVYQPE